ncbi:MAG: AMP-binding protein [Pseudomonadota bacterium]
MSLNWRDFYRDGSWSIPAELNMAAQVCDDRVAEEAGALAVIDMTGPVRKDVSRADLQQLSFRVQAVLVARGVSRGDRVGVLLSQSPLCAAAHIAIWRMGGISVPLFKLFGRSALETRLNDCNARLVITDAPAMLAHFSRVHAVTEADLPRNAEFQGKVPTGPEDPAILIYTSGTTGKPKGALHGHRVLLGHMPGVELSHNRLGQADDCLWTPADWAWIGGLFDVAMPGLALGVPVVAARMEKFDAREAASLCARAGIRNVFLPPTALRMMKAAGQSVTGLRSVACGGEPLGPEMLAWGDAAFGLRINEFYGQTECNMVVSAHNGASPPPGAIGAIVEGHDVAVIDALGEPIAGEGDIAVHRGSAAMMLGYWQNGAATEEKFRGNWMVTGDRGRVEGRWVYFLGRKDDVITSAGYRIGPAEIEDCLLTHQSVATVGVVGKPDPLRTQIVKAYVVLKPDKAVSEAALRAHVKSRLSAHCYPREVAIVDALPMTITGKVIRKELRAMAEAEAEAAE